MHEQGQGITDSAANDKGDRWMNLLIDNYDSFSYNLYQYLGELSDNIIVIRNDEKFLETADLKVWDINGEYFSFERISKYEKMLVYVSRSDYNVDIVIPDEYRNENILYELAGSNKEKLASYGGLVLKKTKKYMG